MKLELIGVEALEHPSLAGLLKALPEGGSLASYLSNLRRGLLQQGFILGVVELDGRLLTESIEEEIGNSATRCFENIRITVAPTDEFVGDTFAECARVIPTMRRLKDEITASVRSGKTSRAADCLATFTDSLALLTRAYQDGYKLLLQLGAVNLSDIDESRDKLRALESTLQDVLEGINREDLVLVSDALEYEFPEHLQALEEEFRFWSRRLQGQKEMIKDEQA